MTRTAMRLLHLGSVFFFMMTNAFAHHAPTEYDFDQTVEVEGTIVEVKWQNPHVTLKVRDSKDPTKVWEIEGSGVSMLRRTTAANVRPQFNENVRVSGNPSRRSASRMFGANLLLASGQELVFEPGGKPRWKAAASGTKSVFFEGASAAGKASIFRVWSTKLDDPWSSTMSEERLTQAAKDRLAKWNPITDSVTKGCEPVGVPMLMEQPYPIEFVQKQNRIVLRIELYDLERVFYLRPSTARRALPKGILGRSTATWEGATLVVTTDGITWPYLSYAGVPMSEEALLVERFTPTSDGTRLQYSAIVTDPVYLKEPIREERSWVARHTEAVQPYNCMD